MTKFLIILTCYILGAYATTDIIRLLQGNSTPVHKPACYCPHCGCRLLLTDQIPLFSYIFSHGQCRYCHTPIPRWNFLLELIIFSGSAIIACATHFSAAGCLFTILFYGAVKKLP